MTSPDGADWRRLLADCRVPAHVIDFLVDVGYTDAATFAFSFVDEAAFETWLEKSFDDAGFPGNLPAGADWRTCPLAGKLRRAWSQAFEASKPRGHHQEVQRPEQPSLEWGDSLPPKLTPDQMREMTEAFERNYHGVLLDDNSLPGLRYWSLVYEMLRPGRQLKWIPWTQILSKGQEKKILEARGTRTVQGLSDLGALIRLATDQPPALSENDLRGSPYRIDLLFRVRRTTFALCQGCHLGAHHLLDNHIMETFMRDYSYDRSLRGPNLHELQHADRQVFEQIYRLRDSENWDLDDALQEFARVRGDVVAELMPRPRPPPDPQPSWRRDEKRGAFYPPPPSNKRARRGNNAAPDKGRGRGGKGKGRGKGGKSRSRSTGSVDGWDSAWHREFDVNGRKTLFCMRWNTGDCSFENCKFAHKCPVPKADGKPCMGNHRAVDHRGGGAPRT